MTEQTGKVYVPFADLKAGMRVSVVVNDPLYEVEDVMVLDSDGNLRVTYSGGGKNGVTIQRVHKDKFAEVHLTLDQAVTEFYRLERAESEAFGVAHALGERRSTMAGIAQSLGWRG